jgi:hypothetical protein
MIPVLTRNVLYMLLLSLTVFWGCTDPTTLGSDLLDEDAAQLEIIDSFTIEASTIPGERVITYSPFTALQGYMVNNLQDPVFGSSRATTHLQARLEFTRPNFSDAEPDSLVLVLAYDTAGFYGNLDEPFTLDVHRASEFLDQNDNFFSDTTVTFDPSPIGSVTITPANIDTVTFVDYLQGEPDTQQQVTLRIPLDLMLAQELINLDTTTYESDTSFIRAFNGLTLRAPNPTQSSISFDMFSQQSGMYLYYKRDTLFRQFRFTFSNFSTKFVTFEHDYTGTPIEPYLQSPEPSNDSILFAQGMQGVNVSFRFPTLSNLNNVILNRAELVVHSTVLGIDDPANFNPAEQLIFYRRSDDGELTAIDDVQLASDDLADKFGGQPEASPTGEGVLYRFTLSTHFQDVIDGLADDEIILSAFPRPERASRIVLTNPSQGPERIRLSLTVTNLE